MRNIQTSTEWEQSVTLVARHNDGTGLDTKFIEWLLLPATYSYSTFKSSQSTVLSCTYLFVPRPSMCLEMGPPLIMVICCHTYCQLYCIKLNLTRGFLVFFPWLFLDDDGDDDKVVIVIISHYFLFLFKCIIAYWKVKHRKFQYWPWWWRFIDTVHCCCHITSVISLFTPYASAWQLCRESSRFCAAACKLQAWNTERSTSTKWNPQEAQNWEREGQFILQLHCVVNET